MATRSSVKPGALRGKRGSGEVFSPRALNRALLARQFLLRRERLSAAEVRLEAYLVVCDNLCF